MPALGATISPIRSFSKQITAFAISFSRDEIGLVHAIEQHAIERVRSRAADSDNFDGNWFLLPFRQTVIFTELDHVIFLLSSHSTKKSSENSSDAAPRPIDLNGLGVSE